MKRVTCAVGIGVLAGCLSASMCGAVGTPAESPSLYLPLDEGRLLSHPARARTTQRGEPLFREAKRRTGLVIDSKGRSVSRLTVTGTALVDPAQGTIAFWMNPLVDYEAGRHTFLNLLSSGNRDEALCLFVEKGSLYLQSRAGGKWPGAHFHFDWIGKPSWRAGTWYHVAVTWGLEQPTVFYVNCRKTWKSDTRLGFAGAAAPVDRIEVGSSGAGKQQADAVLDEILIFNEVLDEGRIRRLMSMETVHVPEGKPVKQGLSPSAAAFETALPSGVKRVWDLAKAYRETTPTRERICINGLWRWQPGNAADAAVPAAGWGYFKVPGSWPGITSYNMKDCQTVFRHPSWKDRRLPPGAAWYQREITVPRGWAGRRIALQADYVNSYADVYIDGKKVGELHFPGGEVDISAACRPGGKHVLSLLTVAMPLNAVMLSYNDSNSAKERKGSVKRRGLCGDVFLSGAPARERIGEVKIDTSVRQWRISFGTTLAGVAPGQSYRLRVRVLGKDGEVKEFASRPFRADDLRAGRFTFTQPWKPARLWDVHTPQHTYTAQVSLLNSAERVLDTTCPIRFGFRELWIDGRDFYLNGTRFFCSAVPLDTGLLGAAWASYEGARENLLRLMSFGINIVYGHNYNCLPGSHLGYGEILKAADDVGMLISFSQPHFGHYKWEAPDADEANGYARHAAFYVRMAQNHPSVVMYSTSHNATGYSDDMNPDMIDGIHEKRSRWSMRNVKKAVRAEAIIKRLDPSRIVYHHSSGNLGSMHTSNFYLNWVPIQERSDWFEHWATEGVKPLFLVEYGMPISWNWAMFRGWYKGKRTFGSANVPWEFCLAEWSAQFLGDRAFRISDMEKKNLRWEAKKFRAGQLWHRWDYPYALGGSKKRFLERHPVWAMYTADNWRAFRTWGVSAPSPWTYGVHWYARDGVDKSRKDLPVDWDGLQRPGFSADFIADRYQRMDLAFERADWIPTVAGKALIDNNQPLLAYIAGEPGRFTEKGHNFRAGEMVEKQIIVINNSRETVRCDCSWSLGLPRALDGRRNIRIDTGQIARIPLRFALPATLNSGTYELSLRAAFSSGERQEDTFDIHVVPAAAAPRPVRGIALFDPKGETKKLLNGMGISCRTVEADADLSGYRILIVGKAALTPDGPAPDIAGVRKGLKVIVFEQTPDVLEQRFGFRIQEYGLRRVFPRVLDHPVLAGLTPENLRDWRGEATIVPPRRELRADPQRGGYSVMRAGLKLSRPWRCGCRGNVASVLIEKPACGDFMSIVDGGFSLQYSPLLEYREGRGVVIFCQMDVTGRTENDAGADRIARNLLAYVSGWTPSPGRRVLYVGEAAGMAHLEAAGLSVRPYRNRNLTSGDALVVGPGGGRTLAGRSAAIGGWLKNGGHLLALGLGEAEANAFLPFTVSTKNAEHIAAHFEPNPLTSLLAGIGPADVHNRDPRKIPLVTGGAADPVANGVLGVARGARVVFCQLAPWTFDVGKQNQKRTFRRTSCLLSRLLGNMGVRATTPLLERFARPAGEETGQEDAADSLWLEQGDRKHPLPRQWKGLPLGKNASPPAGWDSAGFNDARWRKIRVPGMWEDQFPDLEDHNGLFLYRTSFELTEEMAARDVTLVLGAIDDEDWTSVNGRSVGSVTAKTNPKDYWMAVRQYRVPAAILKPGRNILAIKVNDLRQAGGIKGMSSQGSQGASAGRWMRGLYLDEPEEWDDPYRFFRW